MILIFLWQVLLSRLKIMLQTVLYNFFNGNHG